MEHFIVVFSSVFGRTSLGTTSRVRAYKCGQAGRGCYPSTGRVHHHNQQPQLEGNPR